MVRAVRLRYFVCAGGVTFILLGIIGIVLVLLGNSDNNMERLNVSLAATVTGVLMLGFGVLAAYRAPSEEAYKLGRDVGIEEGFEQGRTVGKPVVVELVYPKNEVQIRRHPE